MKKLLLLLTLSTALLFAQETYENYEPQSFFSANDIDAFFSSENGGLLKKILVDGHEYYMQEDGDLLDEDVATIDDEVFGAKSSTFSFGKSKRLLATKVYPTHQKAFYSNCDYRVKDKKLIPIHKTCGFTYRKNKNRSERIEWEHVVPAWHFGHQLRCWQNGGRMTCRKTNSKFKQMEADMHNLVPAIGEINGDRSNFKYGMIEDEKRVYGKVDMEVLFSAKKVEPAEFIYGDIARTYFYMRDRYGFKLSKSQEKMLIAWNNLDPVSAWEKKRNLLIKELQGDNNSYVSDYKKIEQLGAVPDDIVLDNMATDKRDSDKITSDFDKVKDELSTKYAFIFDKLSPTLGSILLFIMTAFVLYRRKNRKKESTKKKKVDLKAKATVSKNFIFLSKLGNVAISFNEEEEVIIEASDKSNPNQQWILSKANQRKEYFFIESVANGKVIEIENADTNDGAKIILGKKRKTNNDYQEWSFETSEEGGYVFVVSKWSLNLLDVKYKKTTDGTKLQSFHKKVRGTENQEWKIEIL
jgi:deoxyribonuclease-1